MEGAAPSAPEKSGDKSMLSKNSYGATAAAMIKGTKAQVANPTSEIRRTNAKARSKLDRSIFLMRRSVKTIPVTTNSTMNAMISQLHSSLSTYRSVYASPGQTTPLQANGATAREHVRLAGTLALPIRTNPNQSEPIRASPAAAKHT